MADESNNIIKVEIGGRSIYDLRVTSKPNYLDNFGDINLGEILHDAASQYMELSNEQIIQQLKDLLIRFNKAYAIFEKYNDTTDPIKNFSEWSNVLETYEKVSNEIQIKRQMLTNAYILKNGGTDVDIILVSINENIQKFNRDFSSAHLTNPKTMHNYWNWKYYEELANSANSMHLDYNEWVSFVNKEQRIYNAILGEKKYKNIEKTTSLIFGKIKELQSRFQFPSYGVSWAVGFEDYGEKNLPWKENLPNKLVFSIQMKMKEYSGGKAIKIYKSIQAAILCQCFNELPSFPQVQKEFYPVKLNGGAYSRIVRDKRCVSYIYGYTTNAIESRYIGKTDLDIADIYNSIKTVMMEANQWNDRE